MIGILLAVALAPFLQDPGLQGKGLPGKGLQDPGGGATYRQLFDRGVAALEAEDTGHAGRLFRAAGERAPGAPLWRVYAAAAGVNLAQSPTDPAASSLPAELVEWQAVDVAAPGHSVKSLSGTGRRILHRYGGGLLVDVGTGRLLARLGPRLSALPDEEPQPCLWGFDQSGRVVVGAGGHWGSGVGLDVRDAETGRPIEVEGALDCDVTAGARYKWFAAGELVPECPYPETVDLPSAEGVLRCHLVPMSDAADGVGRQGLTAQLSEDGGLAMLRNQTVPTTLKVLDRRTEEVVLERSPAGSRSLFAPDASCLFLLGDKEIRCVDLRTKVDRWAAPRDPGVGFMSMPSFTFLGQELVEVGADGLVRTFAADTGELRLLAELEPAPNGPIWGARFVRGDSLLLVHCADGTCVYEVPSGERLWVAGEERSLVDPSVGTVDSAQTLCLIEGAGGKPLVVDLSTGETVGAPPGPSPAGMLAVTCALSVAGTGAVILGLDSGELRRVELATGRCTATTQALVQLKGRLYLQGAGESILAINGNGQSWLLDPESLAVIAGACLPGAGSFGPFSRDGRFCAVTCREPRGIYLIRLTEDMAGEVLWRDDRSGLAAAFSPSGDVLALAGEGRLILLDGRTGEVSSDRDLLPGVRFRAAAFHRESELILGTSAELFMPYGAHVVDTESGRVTGELKVDDPFGGGTVMHVHSSPEAGLVILTASTSGVVAAFDDEDWETRYTQPTHGGNWGTLAVTHESGAALAAVSGMTDSHSRVFDLGTGKIRATREVQGMFSLAVVDGGSKVIGVKDQRLAVLDAGTFETLFTREEGPDGAAWVTSQGVRLPAPGSPRSGADDAQLTRDGWSAPIDCFDPWIYDPLGLARQSMTALPALPVIVTVAPSDPTVGPGGTAQVKVLVSSKEPLIGAVLTLPDGGETFFEFAEVAGGGAGPRGEGPRWMRLPGLPKGWTRVRVAAASGVMSRPHPGAD